MGTGRLFMRILAMLAHFALVTCGAVIPAGCGPRHFAAESNQVLVPAETNEKKVLSTADQATLESEFRRLGDGHQPTRSPAAAAHGKRWSDLQSAVSVACAETEMAVVRKTEHDWGVECQLRTIEDFPGQLIIKRTNDDRVYEATATIGRFQDHCDRAAQLVASIEKHMLEFGKKRKMIDE